MKKWTKGRGALGVMQPLVGRWRNVATGAGPNGVPCTREFQAFGANFIQLDACWDMGERGKYLERALFGKSDEGVLAFWSFTNDGKRSTGSIADGADVHPQALAFIAEMPAGAARMVYWPDSSNEGFHMAVENRVKRGWNRFFEHHYQAMP